MTPSKIISKMTLRQKVEYLSGEGDWHTKQMQQPPVPAISMADGPNGLRIETDNRTRDSIPAICYPAMAALASTWDTSLARRLAQALAEECRAASLDLLLGPGVNIKRSPLCGRNFEYLSEDPYLASEMACAYVQSLQENGTGACLKHFAVNNQEYCRMTVNARVGGRALHEIYLKSFEKTVRTAQPETVMSAYNRVNGIQMSEHPMIRDILRGQWGFQGVVISDWGSVNSRAGGVRMGVDLEMPDSHGRFDKEVYDALAGGALTEQELDACVLRQLQLVQRRLEKRKTPVPFDAGAHRALASEIAARAMVLLKNEGSLLPAAPQTEIAVIGAFAEQPRYQGGGSAHVSPQGLEIPLDFLQKTFPAMTYSEGYTLDGTRNEALLAQAEQAAAQAQMAVVFAGLPDSFEEECFDRADLELPDVHNELIRRVARQNPNTVVVLFAGSAVAMPWAKDVKSILMAYLPGQAAGSALAKVLSGEAEPTGRLAETFPARLEDTPSFGNFPGDGDTVDYAEGIYVGYRWYDKRKIEPLFVFGQGEGYTAFAYEDMRACRKTLAADEVLNLTVTVRNTGSRAGREVVQLYVSQESGRWGYVRQLKGFESIELAPGESAQVSFAVTAQDLAVWSEKENRFFVQDGVYRFEAAHHSRDIRAAVEVNVKTGDYEHAVLDQNVAVRHLLADAQLREAGRIIRDEMIADRKKNDPRFDESKIERMGQSLFLSYPARNFVDLCSPPTAAKLEQRIAELAQEHIDKV